MLKKRYIAIALGVATVLMGSLLFNSLILALSGGEYDPWLDYNEDGTIDVNDLSPLGEAYGSSGDTTKNVSVTNWPEPQKPTFAEVLVLRGLSYELLKTSRLVNPPEVEWLTSEVLLDESMPYPPIDRIRNMTTLYYSSFMPTGWEKSPDHNFTFVPANAPFFIQGDVTIRTTLWHWFECMHGDDNVHWNVTVHLEKTNPEVTTSLASETIRLNRYVSDVFTETMDELGVILHFSFPVFVESGERLQIRFETWARTDNGNINSANIRLDHELGTDDFIAYIPIYQP